MGAEGFPPELGASDWTKKACQKEEMAETASLELSWAELRGSEDLECQLKPQLNFAIIMGQRPQRPLNKMN